MSRIKNINTKHTQVKKVAIFSDFFNSLGGTEYYNFLLAKSLIEKGIDVKVFIGERPKLKYWTELLDKNNIEYFYPKKFHDDLSSRKIEKNFIKKVIKVMKSWQPDVIHTHPAGKMVISWLENDKSQFKKIPIVATEWTTPAENTVHWYQPELKKYINKIDAFIATCVKSKKGIKNFNNYNGKIFLVPHLLNKPQSNYGFEKEKFLSVGCISRLSPEKGIDFLLGAWKKVQDKFPSASLHIYGHGIDEMHLKELVKALNIKDSVVFEGVFKPLYGIDEIAKKHLIFIQPSLFESIPTSILELMARKRIIIATNVGGVCEVINEKYNSGVLINSGSTQEIYESLINIFSSYEKSLTLSNNAYNVYKRKYNLSNIINSILKIYSTVCNKEKQ